VLFPAGEATVATVTFEGLEPVTVTFDKPDCGQGPGNGSGAGSGDGDDTGEPGLPVTGPVAGSIAGVAALLLIGGGVFFFVARRRKVTFTA
jgi:LPXTG-motif cell wall-anchored protein